MESLRDIFEKYAHYGSDAGHADKGSTHSYIEEYARLLHPYRVGCTFMEIGLALGWSLKMWCEYFEQSKIIGVDISVVFNYREIKQNSNKLFIFESDATKPEFLQHIRNQTFDVIIDDGSHIENDQVATFELLKGKMNKGGMYIIEDILALDQNRERFEALHDNCEIFDLRSNKNRFDDVLVCMYF